MNRHLIICTTLLAFPSLALAQPNLWTLRESLEHAWKQNGACLAAQQELEKNQSERLAAMGRFLPEVHLNARTTRIDQPIVLDLDPIRTAMLELEARDAVTDNSLAAALKGGTLTDAQKLAVQQAAYQQLDAAVPHFLDTVQGYWTTTATLQATLPVFAGGRILASVRASQKAQKAAKANLQQVKGDIARQVAERYFQARLAQEALELRDSALSNLSQHTANAHALETAGQISHAEVLRAEVALAEAQRERDDAERAWNLATMALGNSVGENQAILPRDTLLALLSVPSLDSLRALAQQRHAGLQRLQSEKERAGQGVMAAAGEALPSVALFGMTELLTRDLSVLQPHWALGMSLQWNLFRGGQDLSKTMAARHLERSVDVRLVQARKDVDLLIRKGHRELQDAVARRQALMASQTLVAENLRAQKAAFSEGLNSSADVIDATLSVQKVRLADLMARRDALVALASLHEATGAMEAHQEIP